MRKRLLSLVMVCALLMTLVACGKEPAKRRAAEPTAAATPTGSAQTPSSTPTPMYVPDTPTPTPTEVPVTPEPTEIPLTPEPTEIPATPSVTPGTPTVTPVDTITPTPGEFVAPPENCEIAFPTGKLYHYDMELALNAEAHTVGGHVVFDFFNDTDEPWDKLCLRDYSSVFTDEVAAGYDRGTEIEGGLTEILNVTDSRDNSVLACEREEDPSVVWLQLTKPLAPGEEMTLTYDFTAKIPYVADRYGYYDNVFNVSNFYPILAEYDANGWSHERYIAVGECFYSEVADYDVRITVPAGFKVATSGTDVSKSENESSITYTYKAPCVRAFVFCASDRFKVMDATYDGVHVNILYHEDMDELDYMADAVKASFNAARDSLAAFGKAFGRYPYEELDIVIAPIDAGGMEYPNLIIISDAECSPTYTGDNWDIPVYEMAETCVAHEIGHQWFMGIVGSNSGIEPWLDESLASYTEIVYYEYCNTVLGMEDHLIREYNSREYMDLCDPRTANMINEYHYFPLTQSYYDYPSDNTYIQAIYGMGPMALYQMAEILGYDELLGVIREYVRRNAFTNADTEDFFEVLTEYAGTANADLNNLLANVFGR